MINRYLLIPVELSLILLLLCNPTSADIVTIDFKSGGGEDKWGYETGNEGSNPPTGLDITGEAASMNYLAVANSDDGRESQLITKNYWATHHFKFTVDSATLINFTAYWEGYGNQYSSHLYIWNFAGSSWEIIGTGANTATDNIIQKAFTVDLNNYINQDGYLHLVATSFRDAGPSKYLYTDYVKIDACYLSPPSIEKPRTYNNTIEKPYFKNEDVIIRVNATRGDSALTNTTITILNSAEAVMVDGTEMSIEDTIPNGFTYIYTYTPPVDASGNGWRIQVDVNDDAGLTTSDKTIFHISTRPGYKWTGFPLETVKSGMVNGGIFIDGRNTFNDANNSNVTMDFEVPSGTIQWAHFYYSVFGGTPCGACWINLTWINSSGQTEFIRFIGPYETFECQGGEQPTGEDPAQDAHVGSNDYHDYNWGTTCGKWIGYVDVTDIVTSGANTVNINTEDVYGIPCYQTDRRQYGSAVVVVYEGGDNPKEIDYWINEGSMGFNQGAGGINCVGDTPAYQNDAIYFDGTISESISRANYTGLWLTAHANSNHILKFNNHEVLDESGNNISTITEYPYFLHTWDVTDDILTSGNTAWFDLGDNAYISWSLSALVVEKTGSGVPNVAVTVNNAGFSTVVAGSTNEIPISLTLNNTGNASANIEAVFTTNDGSVYGLDGSGTNIIPGNNFKLGPDGSEQNLTSTTIRTPICSLAPGQTLNYTAILIVPPGQSADDYTGTIELSW
ncbi:MAG: hypothetical protein KAJ93_06040 [Methanosarcinales archaeon]|nr:hypothetical protein [Methanosarcinales archaeon]